MYLLEDILENEFKKESIEFLKTWINGDSHALRMWNWAIIKDLQKSLEKDIYTLYRGYKFRDEDDFKMKFERDIKDIKIGQDFIFISKTFLSWTTNKNLAFDFSNPTYDSMTQEYYSNDEMKDFQYDDGDLLGYGLVITCDIPRKKLLCDTSNIQNFNIENEVISLNGIFKTKVLDTKPYYFKEEKEEYVDIDELPKISDKQKADIQMRAIKWMATKNNIDLNDDKVVIEFLSDDWNGDLAIGIIHMFKDTRPNLMKWIRNNAKKWKYEEFKNTAYADYLTNGLD